MFFTFLVIIILHLGNQVSLYSKSSTWGIFMYSFKMILCSRLLGARHITKERKKSITPSLKVLPLWDWEEHVNVWKGSLKTLGTTVPLGRHCSNGNGRSSRLREIIPMETTPHRVIWNLPPLEWINSFSKNIVVWKSRDAIELGVQEHAWKNTSGHLDKAKNPLPAPTPATPFKVIHQNSCCLWWGSRSWRLILL